MAPGLRDLGGRTLAAQTPVIAFSQGAIRDRTFATVLGGIPGTLLASDSFSKPITKSSA